MNHLPTRNKRILVQNIRRCKQVHFPGKGGGLRLAEEAGVPQSTLSNWLSGSRTPTLRQLYRLSKAFDISPLELCGIKEGNACSWETAHIVLLHALMTRHKKSLECNANGGEILKFLKEFKEIAIQELGYLPR
jgi:transcriptional regulator with XRE-family HTH domain